VAQENTKNYPLIDCRPVDVFKESHIKGAASFPAKQLLADMHALPRNSQPVTLCGDKESLQIAETFLMSKYYQVINKLEWNDELKARLYADNALATGATDIALWEPSPISKTFIKDFPLATGKGLDIACGAGRDLVYLAQHGWEMTGIDRNEEALQRSQRLADKYHVSITTMLQDTEIGKDPFDSFSDESFDLIIVARYLHRPLFPYIKRLIKPDGFLLYQTFMLGCEAFGSPRNPNFLLKPGELAECFTGTEILRDEVIHLDDGRPMSAFICRF
jgi:SAM-dependent methyltransferase